MLLNCISLIKFIRIKKVLRIINKIIKSIKIYNIGKIIHAIFVLQNKKADGFVFNNVFMPNKFYRKVKNILRIVYKWLI